MFLAARGLKGARPRRPSGHECHYAAELQLGFAVAVDEAASNEKHSNSFDIRKFAFDRNARSGGKPVEPSAPSSDKTPGVTPNNARMPLPSFESYYAPYYGFGPYYAPFYAMTFPYWTGASDPYTPNPHRNTPGAEAKD